MPQIDIDFQRIRAFGGSQNHGFEELCSQLASLERRPADAVFYRKGIGGDAGVECYVRSATGAETGWQAKFFSELGNSQIAQLNESIGQALAKHPYLDRYIVCLPFNLRDARVGREHTELQRWQTWVAKWQATAAKAKRALNIELWDKSALVERLGRDTPLYSGRAAFWFNETVLTRAWFGERFERARAGLGQRYTPETNIELPIRRTIQGFIRDHSLFDEVTRWGEMLEEVSYRALRSLTAYASDPAFAAPAAALHAAKEALSSMLARVPPNPDSLLPVDAIAVIAKEALSAVSQCLRASWSFKAQSKSGSDPINSLRHDLSKLEDALLDIANVQERDLWRAVNHRRLLVKGAAGVGKSHLFGDVVEHQVALGRPALLILGGSLIEDEPWSQILKQLGLDFTPERFLGAIDAAAQAAGTRAVIFIDAINEHHGIALWRERLASFLAVADPFPHVAVALSCRSTYLVPLGIDELGFDLPQIEHVGFAGRAAEAARFYLDRRGIVRMAAPNLVPEFENPLFLKTCCDFLDKQGLRELPRGLRGVTQIFEFYTQAVAKAVEGRLGLDLRLTIVKRALSALADAFDQENRGYLGYAQAAEILDGFFSSQGQFQRSLLAQLVNEGILAVEIVSGDSGELTEIVRFTFERFSDHRIARQLLDRYLDVADPPRSFVSGAPLHEYIHYKSAYEYAGVIEALAIQLPEQCGLELPDMLDTHHRNHQMVYDAFRESVLWRDQKSFSRRTLDLLEVSAEYTGEDERLRALIAISTEPDNAFNAHFLHDKLFNLSMPVRDQRWSIAVAQEGDSEDGPIETLIVWTAQNGFEAIDDDRAELAAITLSWLFSTSHRGIRDRATKALAALLAPRLQLAARLVKRFQGVNDLYILDRVLAAAYGGALQGISPVGLDDLAEAAFSCVFDREQPIVHVLIRDHARGIVELAKVRGTLPSSFDIAKARPPYRSPWPIEDVPKATIDGYTQEYSPGQRFRDDIVGSAVNDGDFARYIVDRPVREFSTLPIAWVGRSEEEIYRNWVDALAKKKGKAVVYLKRLQDACDEWRKRQLPSGIFTLSIKIVPSGSSVKEEKPDAYEKRVDDAEKRLRAALGEEGWGEYEDQARAHVRAGLRSARRTYAWPSSFSADRARKWICKRAHDLGWTPERFGEFDRHAGRGGRNEHRQERIGKKYQWISFHELVSHLGDNLAFTGWTRRERTRAFQGPWQLGRRDIDPSLIAARGQDEWRQPKATWWMPADVRLKTLSPHARLAWLDTSEGIANDPSLIAVTEPKSNRNWLVISTFAQWNQYTVREGDRALDHNAFCSLKCLLVRKRDRVKLVHDLSGKIINGSHSLPTIDKSSEGYIGEYPWHPVFTGVEHWAEPSTWNGLTVATQPTVTEYLAERGGHDYSIEDSFSFSVPGPGLIAGLGLHLSNGRELSYADASGRTMFFDPSTKESGPGAALVDRDAFLALLQREELDAVWIISGEKNAYGGRRHDHGFGGAREFTSIYWMQDGDFKRQDHAERQEPNGEQLRTFFKEAGAVDTKVALPSQGEVKIEALTPVKRKSAKRAAKPKLTPQVKEPDDG
jgi:hypothetical protein